MSFEKPTAEIEGGPIHLDQAAQERVADVADLVATKAAMDLMKLHDQFIRGTLDPVAFPETAKALHAMIYREICSRLGVVEDIRAQIAARTRIKARDSEAS